MVEDTEVQGMRRWVSRVRAFSAVTGEPTAVPEEPHRQGTEIEGAGLEERKRTVPRMEGLLSELVARIPSDHPTTTPMRFLVDTKVAQDARVLRLLQLAVKLHLEQGLPIQVAGVATAEELVHAQAQLLDDSSRRLLEDLIYTYTPGDELSHRQARALAETVVPGLHPDFVITQISRPVISWFLEALQRLGIQDLTQELQDQIGAFLTAA